MNGYEYRKKEIGVRIRKERERIGLNQKDFLQKIYKSDSSHKTLTAWETGVRLPDLDSLALMADLFNCDLGYLLCDYDEHRRSTADICEQTGLSENAACFLKDLNDDNPHTKNIYDAINALLDESRFDDCIAFWERISLFLFSSSTPYNAQFGAFFCQLNAETVLSLLLTENNQYLHELRKTLHAGKRSQQ